MTRYVGPHPDGVCVVCEQRLIRVAAEDARHPWCDLPTADDDATTRALLTLGASGVGVEVIPGPGAAGPSIAVEISTADLHSAIARRRVFEKAQSRAAALDLDLQGDYLTGPQLVGDVLRGRQVSLEWATRLRPPASTEDAAALWVGRLWGRQQGLAVIVRDGQEATYEWPGQWAELLADCAKAVADGGDVIAYGELRHPDVVQGIPAAPLRWLS